MKWTNRFSASVLCAVLAPFLGMAAAPAEEGPVSPASLRGVDGCVYQEETPADVERFDVTRVEPAAESRASRDYDKDESVDVGSASEELYAEDLFSDATVAAKGLGEEAGWNIQVADKR